MSGRKGMKRREKVVQRPEPCVEDGTGHWKSFHEFGNGRTRQVNCHAFNKVMDKFAWHIVHEIGGSIEPGRLVHNLDFIKAIEEEMAINYNRIIFENHNDTP
jgi:hypothetical protein